MQDKSVAPDQIVTVAEAAAIAGKSRSWVRTYRLSGPLIPAEINGVHAVTLSSLTRFLRQRNEEKLRREKKKQAKGSSRPAHLRLVVDNTK